MTISEQVAISKLRDKGYAVCIFNPIELQGASPSSVEDIMCERGWDAIDDLRGG